MDSSIKIITSDLINELHSVAKESSRLRTHYDLRTSEDDTSQRILNVVEPGTQFTIHRNETSCETQICIHGCYDAVFYHEDETKTGEERFTEYLRIEVCPAKGKFGMQVPIGEWHKLEIKEPSALCIIKDGKYVK